MISIKEIDGGNPLDWGKTSEDYAKYRDIYPDAFYSKIVELGLCTKGQNVLDLGTGTGVLPRNLYKHGANFIGADISENQIEWARRLSAEAGLDIDYIVSSAEDVCFSAKTFDVITACMCFRYLNKDIVLPKIHEMLKDDGRFCVIFMWYLTNESAIADYSVNLMKKFNPTWTDANVFRRCALFTPKWSEALFIAKDAVSFDIPVHFTRESWHGRILTTRAIGPSTLSKVENEAFEREHIEFLNNQPESFDILHFVTIQTFQKRLTEAKK